MRTDSQASQRSFCAYLAPQIERELSEFADVADALFGQPMEELACPIRWKLVFLRPLEQTFETERAKRRL